METITKSVDVNVPVRTAYNQWTQFEDFPHFMENVERVEQRDDTHLVWTVNMGGKTEEWDAEITEQIPDSRVAWRASGDVKHAGVVTFHHINEQTSRVTVQMQYEPDDMSEKIGSALGMVERRVESDLENFKEFIESRGQETGAWRGSVRGHSN